MNYQIITDKAKLLDFIEWLPELEDNEKFYCTLFSRKKYSNDEIETNDKTQLKRFLSDKDRLYNKIKQLEVEVGAYQLKNIAAPQESLALYINPNPRNLKRATYDGIIKFAELLKSDNNNFNPHAEIMSIIQRSLSRKVYLDFDIDTKAFDFDKIPEVINTSCLQVVETRGGYHLLVHLSEIENQYRKTFYNQIIALGVDQTGDQLMPVPGCVQGGFTPSFVNKF